MAVLLRAVESKAAGGGAPAVGKETKVANADKAFGKHMQQEPPQELIEG
jgi:hypothetical protein